LIQFLLQSRTKKEEIIPGNWRCFTGFRQSAEWINLWYPLSNVPGKKRTLQQKCDKISVFIKNTCCFYCLKVKYEIAAELLLISKSGW